MEKRNEFLDVVKCIAIFLVLWGHVVQQTYMAGKIDPDAYLDIIYRIIYTVHMPLFMGLCGYFFSLSINKHNLSKKNYMKKRIKSLVIPMVSFGFIRFLIDVYIGDKTISVFSYLKDVSEIWFLGDLIINSIVVYFLINKLSNNLKRDWKWLFIGMLFSIPLYRAQGIYMYIFFIFGFYIKQYLHILKQYFVRFYYLIYAIFLFLIIYNVYESLGIYAFSINYLKHPNLIMLFINNILKIILGIIGIYIVVFLIWNFSNIKKFNFFINKINEYGRYTLELYLLNIVILEMFLGVVYKWLVVRYNYNMIQDNGFIFELTSTFILSLIIMKILLFITNQIYKYPIISKILFYKVKK